MTEPLKVGEKLAAPSGVSEGQVMTGGMLTNYYYAGDPTNDVLLLLHDGAWGGSALVSWGTVIPDLANDYYVIAPDFLGYGYSDKAVFLDRAQHESRIEQVARMLEALNITTPVHVVGNSFGGAVALRALTEPLGRSFRSVVSIAGFGGSTSRTPLAVSELSRWDGTRDDISRVLALLIDRDSPVFDDQLDARFQMAGESGHYRSIMSTAIQLPDLLKIRLSDPWPVQLAQTAVPMLLVKCSRDVLLEPDWALEIQAAAPHAIIREIDGLHSPQIDSAAELLPVLREFHADIPH